MNAPLDATVLHYQLVAAQAELANVKLERDDLAKALRDAVAVTSGHGDGFYAPNLQAASARYAALLDKIDAGK